MSTKVLRIKLNIIFSAPDDAIGQGEIYSREYMKNGILHEIEKVINNNIQEEAGCTTLMSHRILKKEEMEV